MGREQLLRELVDLVERAAADDGGGRWIVGDAGMGKTAVLDELLERIDPETRTLSATGREGETEFAWGVFEQLIGPLVSEGLDATLPAPQRAAVRSALALDVAPDGTDQSPLAPVVAARNLVLAASGTRPVLVLVDDLQWVDAPSRRALDYLLARIEDTTIAVVVAGRPVGHDDPPVPALPLEPLDPAASLLLLQERGIPDSAVGERILGEVGGNPLLLQAAAGALDDLQRSGRAGLPEVLPVPASVTRLAEKRLVDLDAAARDAVLVTAIAPGGELRTVSLALHVLGHDGGPLEAAEAGGVLRIDGSRVTFSHPTLRSAAYYAATPAERRRAHAAVASGLADDVVRAWHLGQAAIGPDDHAADELARAGDALLGRRAPTEAAAHFERAASLTKDPETAARRLRMAAEALAVTGRSEAAVAALDRADRLGHQELEAARRERLRLRLAARSGATADVVEGLRRLAAHVQELDPQLSAEVSLDCVPALVRLFRVEDIEAVATDALTQAERAGASDLARRAEVVLGGVRLGRGDLDGQEHLDRYAEVLAAEGPVAAAPFLAEVVAPFLGLLRRGPEVDALFDDLDRELRAAVAIPALIAVLGARAVLNHGRDLHLTVAYDVEAIELSEAIDQPDLASFATVSLAMASGVRGDVERTTWAAERCTASPDQTLQVAGLAGRAHLHLARGEVDESVALYETLYLQHGIGHSMTRWEPDWCEALVRHRQTERAREMIDLFSASPMGLLATGGVARVRGMLAVDDVDAVAQFEHGLRFVDLIPNDIVRGRTELVWGERLRRARKRAEARTHLETAVTLLRRVGADPWAERAERELVAAGAAPSAEHGTAGALTNQERDVVRLAVAGATNRAIADQMFLSPRTIETHLGSAYRKLGVANRRELTRWATDGGDVGLDD